MITLMLPLRKMKTSDFFDGKFRCFALKVRHFVAKKSGVFNFRNLLSRKKSFVIFSYIPTPEDGKFLCLLTVFGEG